MDHIAVELVKGQIRITYNTGTVDGIVSTEIGENLNDGRFHHVHVNSLAPTVTITLDRNVCDSTLSSGCRATVQSHQTFSSLNLKYPLFFGGVDAAVANSDPYLLSAVGMTGCIRNVYVNSQLLDLLGDGNDSLPVPGCRTSSPCDSQPCSNGATCIDLWDDFTCSCAVGFNDEDCQLQTTANFLDNQGLHFMPSSIFSVSLEFVTVVNEGVLFYIADVSFY